MTHDRHLKYRRTGPRVPTPLVGRPDVNRKRLARMGWAFTAPALIVIAAVTIFPIVYSVVMSLSAT